MCSSAGHQLEQGINIFVHAVGTAVYGSVLTDAASLQAIASVLLPGWLSLLGWCLRCCCRTGSHQVQDTLDGARALS